MEDQELILKIKENADNESLMELVNRHSGIYQQTVDRYLSGESNYEDRISFLESREYQIYDSVMSYDPDRKAKFQTYLANKTRWNCLNLLNKRKKLGRTIPMEMTNSVSDERNPLYSLHSYEIISLFQKFVSDNFSKKVKKIVDMRYNTCSNKLTPWKKVAEQVGMSIQGVINIHDRCIKKFKEQENYV